MSKENKKASVTTQRLKNLWLSLISSVAVIGCGGDGDRATAQAAIDDLPIAYISEPDEFLSCSVADANLDVEEILEAFYFWQDSMPNESPLNYTSPEAVLEALRVRPIDIFSFMANEVENDAFLDEGEVIAFGFSFVTDADDRVWLTQVYPGPAATAGLARGDELVAVDGVLVSDLIASDELFTALGPAEVGYTVSLRHRQPDGDVFEVGVTKAIVALDSVRISQIIPTTDHGNVGYVLFNSFIGTSYAELDT
ncbi:MAG: hypothetical protein HKM24_04395, partial [Gammaproteobacteria bacterium]|nr:hypothetical protein [Gammaproteobacteria bacterium]